MTQPNAHTDSLRELARAVYDGYADGHPEQQFPALVCQSVDLARGVLAYLTDSPPVAGERAVPPSLDWERQVHDAHRDLDELGVPRSRKVAKHMRRLSVAGRIRMLRAGPTSGPESASNPPGCASPGSDAVPTLQTSGEPDVYEVYNNKVYRQLGLAQNAGKNLGTATSGPVEPSKDARSVKDVLMELYESREAGSERYECSGCGYVGPDRIHPRADVVVPAPPAPVICIHAAKRAERVTGSAETEPVEISKDVWPGSRLVVPWPVDTPAPVAGERPETLADRLEGIVARGYTSAIAVMLSPNEVREAAQALRTSGRQAPDAMVRQGLSLAHRIASEIAEKHGKAGDLVRAEVGNVVADAIHEYREANYPRARRPKRRSTAPERGEP